MTQDEIKAWLAVTGSSSTRWTEDAVFRLNGHGAKYYRGGKNGVYTTIHQDGRLELGNYEGAIPHVGEAYYQPVVRCRYEDFNTAFAKAIEFLGTPFLLDMFSLSDEPAPSSVKEQGGPPGQETPGTACPIIFSRVRLWSDDGEDCEFFMGGAPESYDDIETHEECIDFREFLEQLPNADFSGITAYVTTFTEGVGAGEPQPAGEEDIWHICTAIAEADINMITGWTWQGEHSFTVDYEPDEQLGMNGIT